MTGPGQPDSYRKTQIDTATPETLILMLYDGALRFMGQAEEAFTERNMERISNLLVKIQAIFTELLTALDKEKGGEISTNLERLYLFFLEKLADANVRKDPEPMRQIRPLVEDLRNTWAEAIRIHAKNTGSPGQPPPPKPRLNVAA
ncbi:MAG: flagellar export chaperone FliS [Candidatus Riflebacteria bacterium]|nr:flagellar export chaperone FliS [Candidatus Riflebacteria bacterium]